MIHIAAISQIRVDSEGRAYYRRKRAEGKKPMEAVRCLKRRISDAIYRQLVADQQHADLDQVLTLEAGPGGHRGASHQPSAAGFHPHTSTSATSRTRTTDATPGQTDPEDRAHTTARTHPLTTEGSR
jgi:hypothetical protein